MDRKQEQVVRAWPGRTAAERPAGQEGQREPRLEQQTREAVFDIADFKAIAAFAGLWPMRLDRR